MYYFLFPPSCQLSCHVVVYSRTSRHSCIHPCMHRCIHSPMHSCIHACMQASINQLIHVRMSLYVFLSLFCKPYGGIFCLFVEMPIWAQHVLAVSLQGRNAGRISCLTSTVAGMDPETRRKTGFCPLHQQTGEQQV